MTDHPHVCGEHKWHAKHGATACGSSPRVWGALSHHVSMALVFRIIPTCVGSMLACRSGWWFVRDHPHVCGEHTSSSLPRRVCLGSSPRVWGALVDCINHTVDERIIPTCVGSIHQQFDLCDICSDHPHVCGEHRKGQRVPSQLAGSSPRVWGALVSAFRFLAWSRIIPTCVGSIQARRTAPAR